MPLPAGHATLADIVLCWAGALAKVTAHARDPLPEFGENSAACHFETETRVAVLAKGATAATFADNVSRRAFDNFPEFVKLQGESRKFRNCPYPRAANAEHLPIRKGGENPPLPGRPLRHLPGDRDALAVGNAPVSPFVRHGPPPNPRATTRCMRKAARAVSDRTRVRVVDPGLSAAVEFRAAAAFGEFPPIRCASGLGKSRPARVA